MTMNQNDRIKHFRAITGGGSGLASEESAAADWIRRRKREGLSVSHLMLKYYPHEDGSYSNEWSVDVMKNESESIGYGYGPLMIALVTAVSIADEKLALAAIAKAESL